MSYVGVARADRRPVQRTGLGPAFGGYARRRCGRTGRADVGQIPPNLARTLCGMSERSNVDSSDLCAASSASEELK
jgi:hypothetical protein